MESKAEKKTVKNIKTMNIVYIGIFAAIIAVCSWLPVSYTHLDVYKRQLYTHFHLSAEAEKIGNYYEHEGLVIFKRKRCV